MIISFCCCDKVGFDRGKWGGLSACIDDDHLVVSLAFDVSNISQCKLVFAGNASTCGNAINFQVADWPKVYDWVRGGGRLFIAAEHSGDYDPGSPPPHTSIKCLKDMPALNDFLGALGSKISYIGGDLIDRQPTIAGVITDFSSKMVPTAAVSMGTILYTDRFGALTGGSSVWAVEDATYTDQSSGVLTARPSLGPMDVVKGERIGDGFVFVSGDGNSFDNAVSGCSFLQALLNTDSDKMGL